MNQIIVALIFAGGLFVGMILLLELGRLLGRRKQLLPPRGPPKLPSLGLSSRALLLPQRPPKSPPKRHPLRRVMPS